MRNMLFFLFVIFALIGCKSKDEKPDIFFVCDGKIGFFDVTPNVIEVSSSFYVGKEFVEQEGERYTICEEDKTQIKFADNCKDVQQTAGTIDLITRRIDVNKALKKVAPNLQAYNCEVAKNPRQR
jgi:hypothetical protein